VGKSKKKKSHPKGQKQPTKSTRERELRFSTVFCTRERICISAKRAAIAKLSLVLLRLFFFRRSVLFHHKDRYTLYIESALFFWSRACIFSTSSSSKKRRGKFFFGLSERLGRNKCPSSELCSHVHERLWMKRVWFLTTRGRFEKVFL